MTPQNEKPRWQAGRKAELKRDIDSMVARAEQAGIRLAVVRSKLEEQIVGAMLHQPARVLDLADAAKLERAHFAEPDLHAVVTGICRWNDAKDEIDLIGFELGKTGDIHTNRMAFTSNTG